MSIQSYLIDTNILIGLEDNTAVKPAYAQFSSLSAKHKIEVFVHEAAHDDIARDKNLERRKISLSKIAKYQVLAKRTGLQRSHLVAEFGVLKKPNDVVDATLLHALRIGAVDFLVTQDKGLHERAQKHSSDLGRRVLFLSDATDLLTTTYEPKSVGIRHVTDVQAHTIDHEDTFFDSLREGYPEFDDWWRDKCVKQRRSCWVVYDDKELAGLIVRKDESETDTDALTPAQKILKICTFKVRPEMRGVKLGELLLKQALWYCQSNGYDLAYVTTYEDQAPLISLLEYYGFSKTGEQDDGELIYERTFSNNKLTPMSSADAFTTARKNYPRFSSSPNIQGFGIPIKEGYHDILYPDLWDPHQPDFFEGVTVAEQSTRPGNTIRKVYLCRAPSNLGPPGSILFFYKGKSNDPPSQAITAIGILDEMTLAHSTKELMLKTGGRSVYSENQLSEWEASDARPVKVINYLLVAYVKPPIAMSELRDIGIIKGANPPQSIYSISEPNVQALVGRSNLSFET